MFFFEENNSSAFLYIILYLFECPLLTKIYRAFLVEISCIFWAVTEELHILTLFSSWEVKYLGNLNLDITLCLQLSTKDAQKSLNLFIKQKRNNK